MIDSQGRTGFPERTRKPAPRWTAYAQAAFFVVIGVVVLFGGIHRYAAVQPVAGGSTTTGTISAVSTTQNCGKHGCHTYNVPTIQFTAGGVSFTFTGPESSNSMKVGDPVQVSYDPRNPAVARDISASVGEAWLEIGLGVLSILIGAGSFLLGFRRLHTALNLSSARDESGWVGHSGLHSVRGVSAGVVVMIAIIVIVLVEHVVR